MEALGSLEKKLYDAAATGDTMALRKLQEHDPLLLDRVSFTSPNKTPLHVATMRGHLSLVREILNLNPQLVELLDSQQASPLHISTDKGYLEITRELLSAAPDMCLSRDCQGRNPLHLAVMKGHVEVLREMVEKAPMAAREKVDGGLTALHLCVKHRQFEALKVLIQSLDEIIDEGDDDGDTVLHMAVRDKQIESTRYLVGNSSIDLNAKNSKRQTPLDISYQYPNNSEMTKILKPGLCKSSNNSQNRPEKWLTKKRDSIMVVAILIATMAFQAGVSPPGGVWQNDPTQDPKGNQVTDLRRAGEAVMAYKSARAFKSFIRSNTTAFVSSLSTILLLISGLPFRRPLFMWILTIIMWLTVTSIAITYATAIVVVSPRKDKETVGDVMEIGIAVWCGVMGILLVGNTVRLIDRWLRKRGVRVWRPRMFEN